MPTNLSCVYMYVKMPRKLLRTGGLLGSETVFFWSPVCLLFFDTVLRGLAQQVCISETGRGKEGPGIQQHPFRVRTRVLTDRMLSRMKLTRERARCNHPAPPPLVRIHVSVPPARQGRRHGLNCEAGGCRPSEHAVTSLEEGRERGRKRGRVVVDGWLPAGDEWRGSRPAGNAVPRSGGETEGGGSLVLRLWRLCFHFAWRARARVEICCPPCPPAP